MAKEIRSCVESWIEVAPALVISPLKTSSFPRLETITEEESEEYEEDLESLEFPSVASLNHVSSLFVNSASWLIVDGLKGL
ncbi:hypothetical protein OWV82_021734 [Melia azedarach]|uniref:Uncharacterized protein n=1 Tax=Melia azedarach TaxID=155640 RepID=A0ACC1X0B6_MELAZ|nr:hypothetical protein OWV82_021734 [Melia azedarach]